MALCDVGILAMRRPLIHVGCKIEETFSLSMELLVLTRSASCVHSKKIAWPFMQRWRRRLWRGKYSMWDSPVLV